LPAGALGLVEVLVEPASAVVGHIAVPGDKSISHRAVLIAAICDGATRITGFGRSADTEATVRAAGALGVEVEEEDVDVLVVHGAGLSGLREPEGPIDCGNSGTLMRLLAGILVGQEGRFELTGDESLRSRPMDRIAEPLGRMGAHVETSDGHAPLTIEGGELTAIQYELPVPSAQVKSCLLLAGLYARGRTRLVEPVPTRDHTELLLDAAGAVVRRRGTAITIAPAERLELEGVEIPGDVSSAAPFLVAATLLAGSELTVHGVGLNPTRTGFLDLLAHMGARLTVVNRARLGRETAGDLDVRSAELVAASVTPAQVPGLVDELPLFALAAGCARGESVVRGAGELRAKETDRIDAVTTSLRDIGIHITATDDGFRVRGVPSRPKGGAMNSQGDHRIAMLGGTGGVVSREGVRLAGADAVAASFPGFFELLDQVAHRP
jgi:3-phosphoshikimate 1-carboxyvinyltransferase